MSSKVQSLADYGTSGIIIDVECNLSNNLPLITIVGFAGRAVDEARERVRGAFASAGLELPRKRITINLAPADIPKDSSSFDLAIAAAIIMAGSSPKETSRTATRQIFFSVRHAGCDHGRTGLGWLRAAGTRYYRQAYGRTSERNPPFLYTGR